MHYTILNSPIGKIFLVKGEKGLLAAHLLRNQNDLKETIDLFSRKFSQFERKDRDFVKERALFERYFSGKKEDFKSLKLDLSLGTDYYQKVWQEARKISYGKTKTYKSLAEKLGHKGYRSVGQAMARNPLLLIIPCHRVIGSDGGLRGFGAGIDIKEYLLDLENASQSE